MTTTTTLRRSSLLAIVTVVAVIGVMLAIQRAEPPAGQPNGAGELEVVLGLRHFEPDQLILPTDEPLTLRFVNEGDVDHTIAFGRDPVIEDGHPAEPGEDMLAGLAVETDPLSALVEPTDEVPWTGFRLAPGESMTAQFTLPTDRAGEWTLGCYTAQGCYYETGFRADVTVE